MSSDSDRSGPFRRIGTLTRALLRQRPTGAASAQAPGRGLRIWIHDDLAERHPARALTRALVAQGAVVGRSGKFSHLSDFPRTTAERIACESALQQLLDWEPHVVLAMRPGSLPPYLHLKIRASGARTVAWYSDGAVYFNSAYGEYARMYDIVLHTGGRENHERYLNDLRINNGVEFPFFTDAVEHPTVATASGSAHSEERRALFLGNTHDGARSDRADYLRALGDQVLHLGRKAMSADATHPEEKIIDHGYELRAVTTLVDAGLNLSQRMSKYEGSRHESAATRAGTVFPFPSRIAQYLSLGLPVLSRDLDPLVSELAPEIVHVPRPDDALKVLTRGFSPDDHASAARRARETFDAWGRAEFLLRLLEDDEWRRWGSTVRCTAFAEVSSAPARTDVSHTTNSPDALREKVASSPRQLSRPAPATTSSLRVILTGTGWTDTRSDLQIAARALRRAGHEVLEVNPYTHPDRVLPDSTGNFTMRIDVDGLSGDAVLLAGNHVDLAMNAPHVPCAHWVSRSSSPSILDRRRADHLPMLFTVSPETAEELRRSTGAAAHAIGALLDIERRDGLRSLLEDAVVELTDPTPRTLTVFREHTADVNRHAPWVSTAVGFTIRIATPSTWLTAGGSDAELASLLSADAILHVPDSSGVNPRPSASLGWAGLGPGIDFVPRIARPTTHLIETAAVSVGSARELDWKCQLYTDPTVRHSHRYHLSSILDEYTPETVLSHWLANTLKCAPQASRRLKD